MRRKILAATVLLAAAAVAIPAGVAVAGSHARQQRIAIAVQPKSSTFVLTPLTAGAVEHDSGTVSACCWTRRFRQRDGQSIEVDNPKLVFTGKNGTFTWREAVTWVDSDNDYSIGTGVWRITRGTGAYAHLRGTGREAIVQRTSDGLVLASKSEGVVHLP